MNSNAPVIPDDFSIQIDLQNDELLTFGQARKLLPRPVSPTTWWRWRTKGVNGVKLPALRCGNVWMTSRQAVHEFIRVQSIAFQSRATEPNGRSLKLSDDLKAAGLL